MGATCCCEGICSKCYGGKLILVGAVVLVTAMNWPEYIWYVIGSLMILKGILKLAMPTCGHCAPTATKKGKKK